MSLGRAVPALPVSSVSVAVDFDRDGLGFTLAHWAATWRSSNATP